MKNRKVDNIINGVQTSDGAGVKLRRIIGGPELNMLDPFLLFDDFGSDNADDYIAGFPSHPHRGFETITYMISGKFRHKDSAGNEGFLSDGSVQWMTAGKGVIHSEMPEKTNGKLKGFQLWLNLPRSLKMIPRLECASPKSGLSLIALRRYFSASLCLFSSRRIVPRRK